MKRILFIIPFIPYPLNSGGNQAFFNMVDYIRHKMSVSILLYPKTGSQKRNVEELRKIWGNVEFFVFTKENAQDTLKVKRPIYYKWLGKMKSSIERKLNRQLLFSETGSVDWVRKKSTLHHSVFSHFDSGYIKYVGQVARQGFDIIQVEFYELISLGYVLPADVKTIFLHHELRYVHNENEMSLFKEVTDEDRMSFEIAKEFERNALQRFKYIIALTAFDCKVLEEFVGHKECIYASPAVVQQKESSKIGFVPATTNRLTFFGSGNHCPNLDAVAWFCNEIAPHLRNLGVSFTFQVSGMWNKELLKELCASCPEMELVGYVDDLQHFLSGSIVLVPIRIGSGMRMKILDAVFSKTPFVTTTKGVEGLDFRDGEECLIADTAKDFATTIARLADDRDLQARIVNQAEYRLRQLYNPQEMLDIRLAIYNRILEEPT